MSYALGMYLLLITTIAKHNTRTFMTTFLKNIIKIITLPNPSQSYKTKLFLQCWVIFIRDSNLTKLSLQLPLVKLNYILIYIYFFFLHTIK